MEVSVSVFSKGFQSSSPAEMLHSLKRRILLQSLTLFLLGPASEAASLGLTVHVVPLQSDGGKTVGNFSTQSKLFGASR